MIGLKRGVVLLEKHDDAWDRAARDTAEELKRILGSAAVDIQHVGSTAIKSIKAKPIIDIAVGVSRFEDVIEAKNKLGERGFIYRPNDSKNDMLFVCGSLTEDIRTHHIHFVIYNSMEWRNYINFRDYLNKFTFYARKYEALKLSLAEKYPYDRDAYTAGKADLINEILRCALTQSFLGKTVRIEIDRPIGYVHKKKKYTLVYNINYGYIPGVIGGDNEELDVYLLGVNEPVKEYNAKIIGIVHREDDEEDKLVGAPENIIFNQAEIAEAVHFQEKYHKTHVEGLYQKSCGAVIWRYFSGNEGKPYVKYLVLKQKRSGTWSFPKGHMERGETEEDTALREIYEETGLTPVLSGDFRETVEYTISDLIYKTNVFFMAEACCDPEIPKDEIIEYKWVHAEEARVLLTHSYDLLMDKAEAYIAAHA